MNARRPVLVYGASGYTGRLVCEFLRDFRIPFIAAGRSAERIEAAMAKVPGIETADYEIAVVEHDVDALTRLLEGTKVVCNTVGPFELYGETVVRAALAAGAHYLDTTGEQQFMLPMKREYGAAYAEAGLLLAPATAYMHTTLDIAVSCVAEHSEITTVNAQCAAMGIPTYGSTQTVVRAARADEYYLKQRKLALWPRGRHYEVTLPLWLEPQISLPWTGTAIPLWYEDHPHIENLKALVCFADNRELMERVVGLIQMYETEIKDKSHDEQEVILTQIGEQIQAGMPPRENRQIHRNLDVAIGYGQTSHVEYRIHSTAAYQQTGLLEAYGAARLLSGEPRAVGFQSPCRAFGHRELLAVLEQYGYARLERAR